MEKDKEPTEMLFRKYRNGDIIALMPYVIETFRYNCQSYMHVGQHGPARLSNVIKHTKPAKVEEYAELKAELESIGYTVKPIDRVSQKKLQNTINSYVYGKSNH